ncbi:MAG: DUF6785 family protein [Armatimonadota bacterium]|nr:DUF6785 family protein [Armatimonadota bacterium]
MVTVSKPITKTAKPRYGLLIFVGIVIVALCAWFRAPLDLWLQGSRIGFGQLPIAPVALLVILVWFVQPLLRQFGVSLSRSELALIFCMLFATTRFWSSSYSVLPLSLGASAFYYANPANNYELLHRHIPQWLVPQDKLVIKAFYEGSPDGKVPWGYWIPTLATWTLSTTILWVSLLGLTFLFRRRWISDEKLVFPVAQVPLAILDERNPLKNQRPFWFGFIFPLVLHSWNGLAVYFPTIPSVPLRAIPIGFLFPDPPFSILSDMTIDFYPSVIGTAYLTSTDVALGFWFFHFLRNLERVALFAAGLQPGGVDHGGIDAITRGQEIGAFFAICGILAWSIWQNRKTASLNKAEKASFFIFLFGLIGLTVFWTLMGADWWASLAYFIVFFVVMLVLARISCQSGCMFVAMDFHPHNISGYLFGQMSVGLKNLVVLMFPHMAYMMERDVVSLPYLMNSTKVAAETGLSDREFLFGVFMAYLVATLFSPVASLAVFYTHGGLNLNYHYATRLPRWAWDKYIGWFSSPSPADLKATLGIFAGATFTLLLTSLHHRIPHFPFHPLGFTLADSLVVRKVWFSIFLGWLSKGLILRYGGHKFYWAWRPAFIGMVVGELMAAAIWLFIDATLKRKGHDVFPGFPPL